MRRLPAVFSKQVRRLSWRTGQGHAELTAESQRGKVLSSATLASKQLLTPSTVELRFQIENPLFDFQSGQWVDCFIPGVTEIGGFTIVTPPDKLPELHLAVKGGSTHAPTVAAHSAKVGDVWQMRAGGDFQMKDSTRNMLFLAGGIGINPLIAMLREHSLRCGWNEDHEEGESEKRRRVILLHSARNTEELAFREELIKMAANSREAFHYVPWVTRGGDGTKRFDVSDIEIQLEILGRPGSSVEFDMGTSSSVNTYSSVDVVSGCGTLFSVLYPVRHCSILTFALCLSSAVCMWATVDG